MTKKQVGKETVYLVYTQHSSSSKKEQELQHKNLEAGPGVDTMEGCYLLACFPMAYLAYFVFLLYVYVCVVVF